MSTLTAERVPKLLVHARTSIHQGHHARVVEAFTWHHKNKGGAAAHEGERACQ